MLKSLRISIRFYSSDGRKGVFDLLKNNNKTATKPSALTPGSKKKSNPSQKESRFPNSHKTKNQLHHSHKVQGIHVPHKASSIHPIPEASSLKKGLAITDLLKRQLKTFDPETFKFKNSINQNENDYLTEKIRSIYETNKRFQIVHKEGAEVKRDDFIKFFGKLKEEETFDILTIKKSESDNNDSYPFLVIVNKKAALKTYQDKVSEELTKKFGRTVEKKRTTNVKYVKVSWSINQYDLESQKTNEIIGLLKKNNKLVVVIDTKEALEKLNLNNLKKSEHQSFETKINELERIKREKILSYLLKLFNDNATVDFPSDSTSGFKLTQKIMFNVSPTSNQLNQIQTKNVDSIKETKMTRQEKQKLREEQKRLTIEQRKREFEESLKKI